jgi:hypothetical protein
MAISTALQENIVQRAAVALRERAGLLKGFAMDASPDPGNLGKSKAVGDHVSGTAGDVTPSSGNGPSTTEDSFTAKQVTLDTWKNQTVTISADDMATNNLSQSLELGIANAVGSVINAVSESANSLYTLIPYTSGVAGTTLFNNGSAASIDRLADIGAVLDGNDVPDAGQRRLVLSNAEAANYKKVPSVQNANQMGNDMVRITGMLGMDSGFMISNDSRIKSHTVGTITTGLATKAATAQSGVTSLVCTTAASTGACALKEGDIVVVDGVSYALQADATQASAATDVTLTLDRPLEIDVSGGEAVTIATGFGTGTQNIAGDMRGFGIFNRIPAESLAGMTALNDPKVIVDPITGLSLLAGWYGQNHRTVYEISCLYGVNVVQSKLLVRAQGV